MGIQGLLQVLRPYVEPVHVKKYSGTRVGIDAYSWLHKGAYSCSWQQLQGNTQQNSDKVPPYVSYCIHRIKMLQYNNITPVVVFDGGRLPLKTLTEQSRRRSREDNLQKAQDKLAVGDILSAQEYFQKAVEITPQIAHELIKALRDIGVEYVVAPYEADAQLAHLAKLAPEEGGVATIITEDSDLLAYGCPVVLFKMDKFGNGEEISLQRILHSHPPPANGLSFRNFTQELFLAMCVLSGCDFLHSIPGIGVKKAHTALAKYRNISRVLNILKIQKQAVFPEGYISQFWQAKAIFTHARVYEPKRRSLVLLNPLPAELLKQFGGDTEFLGPDLPQGRARAIAEGHLDPTTMCSFDPLSDRKPTSSVLKVQNVEPIRTPNDGIFFSHKENPTRSAISIFGGSKVSSKSFTDAESMQSEAITNIPFEKSEDRVSMHETMSYERAAKGYTRISESSAMNDQRMKPGQPSQPTFAPNTPPEVDHKFLTRLQLMAFPASDQEKSQECTSQVQATGREAKGSELGYDVPNNNPFKRQKVANDMIEQNSLSLSSEVVEVNLGWASRNCGLSGTSPCLRSPSEGSQALSCSGGVLRASCTVGGVLTDSFQHMNDAVTCLNYRDDSAKSSTAVGFAHCTTTHQRPTRERASEVYHNYQASQTSLYSNSSSVLTDICPIVSAEFAVTNTTKSEYSSKDGHQQVQTARKSTATARLTNSKSTAGLARSSLRGKRLTVDSIHQSRLAGQGGILRFFKPTSTPNM